MGVCDILVYIQKSLVFWDPPLRYYQTDHKRYHLSHKSPYARYQLLLHYLIAMCGSIISAFSLVNADTVFHLIQLILLQSETISYAPQ